MIVYQNIVSRIPIDKGWSGDQKYCATTDDGQKYLLRISSLDRLERKRREYEKMSDVAQLGIPMCLPVEFGTCEEGAYSIQSWIEGEDAESTVMSMDAAEQYRYGQDAGRILAKIHTIPAPMDAPNWETRFNAKIDRKIMMYDECPLKYENGHLFLSFLADNRHLLSDRPQTYQHGDYHIGNMMIDKDGKLTIIDFDRDDFGDPWEEFNRIVWCAQAAPAFASGMVDGYFDGDVPMEFWKLMALYISSNTLSSLPWAVAFGEAEITTMRNQAAQVLEWYDGMKNVVPTWYKKEPVLNIQHIRRAEAASHTDAYEKHELYTPGSWLAKPVKTVVDLLPCFDNYKEFRGLDLGCGVGRNCIAVAQHLKNIPCQMDCVDILELAIEKLSENAQKYQVADQICGICCPIDEYSILENAYDFIMAVSALEHVESPAVFAKKLAEIRNGLRYGGIACLIVNSGVVEQEKDTGKEIAPQFEVNLPTAQMKDLLLNTFAGWEVIKHTVVHQKYDIPRDWGISALETDVVTYVIRKKHNERCLWDEK